MTREIIETILNKEKQADDLIKKAGLAALEISRKTDREIGQLRQDAKQEKKNLTAEAGLKFEEKASKEEEKQAKKLQAQIDVLADKARHNFAKTKKWLIEELLA